MEALDPLTDFVGRPKLDAAELDKDRGVVIQEIARYKDQPSAASCLSSGTSTDASAHRRR